MSGVAREGPYNNKWPKEEEALHSLDEAEGEEKRPDLSQRIDNVFLFMRRCLRPF